MNQKTLQLAQFCPSCIIFIYRYFSQTFLTKVWASGELCHGAAMCVEISFAVTWNPLNFCEWWYIWKSREKQSMSKNRISLEVVHFRLNHNPKKKAEYCASLLSQNIHIVHADPRILISEDKTSPNIKRYNDPFSRMLLHMYSCHFLMHNQ